MTDENAGPNELPMPPEAEDGEEILRVWVGKDGNLHMVYVSDPWPDHRTWGIFLSDLLEHVVEGIHEDMGAPEGVPKNLIKKDIIEVFEAERTNPQGKAKSRYIV